MRSREPLPGHVRHEDPAPRYCYGPGLRIASRARRSVILWFRLRLCPLASVEAAAPPHHHDSGAAMPQPPTSSVASRTFALWHWATPPGKPLGWLCATRRKNTVSLTTRTGGRQLLPSAPRPRDGTGDSSGDLQARVVASCHGSPGGEFVMAGRAARRDTPGTVALARSLHGGSGRDGYAQWASRSMAVRAAGSNIHMITGSSHK